MTDTIQMRIRLRLVTLMEDASAAGISNREFLAEVIDAYSEKVSDDAYDEAIGLDDMYGSPAVLGMPNNVITGRFQD